MKMTKKNRKRLFEENLISFIFTLALFLFAYFNYDDFLETETSSTSSKAFNIILRHIDSSFGKEYVIGIIFFFVIWTTISAIRSYYDYKHHC